MDRTRAWPFSALKTVGVCLAVAVVVLTAVMGTWWWSAHDAASALHAPRYPADGPLDLYIADLGGTDAARRKLRLYLALPTLIAPHKDEAALLLGLSGSAGRECLLLSARMSDIRLNMALLGGRFAEGEQADRFVTLATEALGREDRAMVKSGVLCLACAGKASKPSVELAVRTLCAVGKTETGGLRSLVLDMLSRLRAENPAAALVMAGIAQSEDEALRQMASEVIERAWPRRELQLDLRTYLGSRRKPQDMPVCPKCGQPTEIGWAYQEASAPPSVDATIRCRRCEVTVTLHMASGFAEWVRDACHLVPPDAGPRVTPEDSTSPL